VTVVHELGENQRPVSLGVEHLDALGQVVQFRRATGARIGVADLLQPDD
jgi:hypothetical protein